MGEEIGAANPFTTTTFAANKEDLIGERTGNGRFLFAFYQSLIGVVVTKPAARSTAIDVIYRHNDNRVIAFTRTAPNQNLLVIASLNDSPFTNGYVIGTDYWRLPAGGRQEIFNSDASVYGGSNIGNGGAALEVNNGQINAVVPAHGFVVLEKLS
jgi:1,4-alpha-glucan branching enzyme